MAWKKNSSLNKLNGLPILENARYRNYFNFLSERLLSNFFNVFGCVQIADHNLGWGKSKLNFDSHVD